MNIYFLQNERDSLTYLRMWRRYRVDGCRKFCRPTSSSSFSSEQQLQLSAKKCAAHDAENESDKQEIPVASNWHNTCYLCCSKDSAFIMDSCWVSCSERTCSGKGPSSVRELTTWKWENTNLGLAHLHPSLQNKEPTLSSSSLIWS